MSGGTGSAEEGFELSGEQLEDSHEEAGDNSYENKDMNLQLSSGEIFSSSIKGVHICF